MIVDSSAMIAILLKETGYDLYAHAIARARTKRLGSPAYLECSAALLRLGISASHDVDALIERSGIEVVDFTAHQARIARRAYARYGKGRHEARLNFGDCMAYALAVDYGEPLLYKSDDFALTDVVSALPPR